MSTTPTVPLGFSLIQPGSSIDAWGPLVNANTQLINNYLAGIIPQPAQKLTATLLNSAIAFAGQFAGADMGAKI